MIRGETDDEFSDAEFDALRLEGLCHLNQLQSGSATEADELKFLAWRRYSPRHEAAFRSAMQLQRLVRAVEQRNDLAQPARAATILPFARPASRITRRTVLSGGIAASVAAAMFVGGRSLELIPSPAELASDYRTGTGESRVVRLADGASVNLNTRTSIALRDGARMPSIELIRGEVVMQTGRGGSAALFAEGGESIGRDGRFSARRTDDDVCITCLAGSVTVAHGGTSGRLNPGEQMRYNDAGLGPVVQTDPRVVTAWQNGVLIFRDKPMREVVAEINRYRAGRVILSSDRMADRRLSGTYYINRLDEFFSQVELALDVTVTRFPAGVVVLS